jgi:maleamate amidohydrolase
MNGVFPRARARTWFRRLLTGATIGAPIPAYTAPLTAVLAVDLQQDFLSDGGRMQIACTQVDSLLRAANAVLDSARQRGWRVVHIGNEFSSSDWLRNLVQRGAAIRGTPGAELDERVSGVSDVYFPKNSRDAFANPALDEWLRVQAVDTLIVFGVMGDACVRATVLGALNRGYQVTLVKDAVGAMSDRARDAALKCLALAGAKLVTAAELLYPVSAAVCHD